MILLSLLILSTPIGVEPPPPLNPCPLAHLMGDQAEAEGEPTRNACEVEQHLRRAGWSDPWIVGALANAWHESGWLGDAVGDSGHAVGFWQLRDDGLGGGMGDLRYSLLHATDRIVSSARRQRMDVSGGDPEEAARQFCIRIMRPSDKVRKGELRAETAARLSAERSI